MFRGVVAGLTTGALWGLTFVATRVVQPFTAFDLAIARYSIFGLTSLALMLHPSFRPRDIRWRHVALALALGGAGYVGYFIAASFAVQFAGAAIPPLVIGLLPVCLAVIGNRAGDIAWRRLVVPLAMILAGILVANLWALAHADAGGARRDVLLGIACSLVALGIWIAYGVANARALRAAHVPNPLAWTGLQGVGALLGTLPLVALVGAGAPSALPREPLLGSAGLVFLAWAAVMGIAGSWLATWCWAVASRRLPLSLSAQLIVAETVFGLIYGFIYERRWPSPAELIGIALQLVGVVVAIAVFAGPGRGARPPDRAPRARGGADDFGMDTNTLAGPLEAKLRATRDAGFTQVMLKASDLAGHAGGVAAAARAIRASGLRVTGLQVLRDFEGLSGNLHSYKLEIADAMLDMARAVNAPLLLVCSSISPHACADLDVIARDLRALAGRAAPLGLKVAYEGLSWGRTVNEFTTAWDVVRRADAPNLGLCLDSFHMLATQTPAERLADIETRKVFLVQLADFLWQEITTADERIATARHFRVFPGEGSHSAQIADLVAQLASRGYTGDYSFEVFNDDYLQLPLPLVVQRARTSARWLGEEILQRALRASVGGPPARSAPPQLSPRPGLPGEAQARRSPSAASSTALRGTPRPSGPSPAGSDSAETPHTTRARPSERSSATE